MRARTVLGLLACGALSACTTYSGVETTPTYAPARLEPARPEPPDAVPGPTEPRPARRGEPTGARAVHAATKAATVDPREGTMDGAVWVIGEHDPTRLYRVRTRLERVTTVLLPEGEAVNKVAGGDVEGFLVEASYSGPRPAISVLPVERDAGGNIAVSTTGGLYLFEVCVTAGTWNAVVDVRRAGPAPRPGRASVPVPQGGFDRLEVAAPDGQPAPAWAPVEAWADAVQMVVRFRAPLPTLPGLFAGRQGEQVVNYRVERTADAVLMVTSRRVTEAELRLGDEVVRIAAPTPAFPAGSSPAQGGGETAWHAAPALPTGPLPSSDGGLIGEPSPGLAAAAPAPDRR
jgi:hypothetical protein